MVAGSFKKRFIARSLLCVLAAGFFSFPTFSHAGLIHRLPVTFFKRLSEEKVQTVQDGYLEVFEFPLVLHGLIACAASLMIDHNLQFFGNNPWIEYPAAALLYGVPIFGVTKFLEKISSEIVDENKQSLNTSALTYAQSIRIRKAWFKKKKQKKNPQVFLLFLGNYNLVDEIYLAGTETDSNLEEVPWVEEITAN